jgi:endonuclease/exonuclease/phosphatase family metal-dependent hydrolase
MHERRRLIAGVVLALGAEACTPRVSAGDPVTGESSTPRVLKIATWNLEWLNAQSGAGTVRRSDEDYTRLRKYAERLAADVVAVQEVDGEEALRRIFDDATYDYHVASQSGIQRTGFAYRAGLRVVPNPDYAALDVGGVRMGTDLTLLVNGRSLRLLSVHLKSGCFDEALSTASNDCTKLAAQLPVLERWIDARAAANEPFVVLGDFNRRMRSGEAFYSELDDGDPPNADLTLVTDGRTSHCWGGRYAQLIDHIVVSRNAAPWLVQNTFAQQDYDVADAAYKASLSDHCPLSVMLAPGATSPSANELAGTKGDASSTPGDASGPPRDAQPRDAQPGPGIPGDTNGTAADAAPAGRIKGNISSDGKRLYHLPECPSYDDTKIDTAEGERWFATEAEAVAAGWRKAGNCP